MKFVINIFLVPLEGGVIRFDECSATIQDPQHDDGPQMPVRLPRGLRAFCGLRFHRAPVPSLWTSGHLAASFPDPKTGKLYPLALGSMPEAGYPSTRAHEARVDARGFQRGNDPWSAATMVINPTGALSLLPNPTAMDEGVSEAVSLGIVLNGFSCWLNGFSCWGANPGPACSKRWRRCEMGSDELPSVSPERYARRYDCYRITRVSTMRG